MVDLARLERFYRKYNPEKLHEIEDVAERYKGKEKQLFAALVKKYGPEPSAEEDLGGEEVTLQAQAKTTTETVKTNENENKNKSTSKSPTKKAPQSTHTSTDDYMHARLLAFYQKYNPEKVDEVAGILVKYKGKEAQLFNALVKKYGPEPDDDDDDEDDDEEDENETQRQQREHQAQGKEDEDEEEEEEVEGGEEEEEEEDEIKMKNVIYCPIDTLPPEYCEYGPMFNECKAWLGENCPQLFLQKYNRTVEDFLEAERLIAEGVEGITLEAEGKSVKKKKKSSGKTEGKSKDECMIYVSKSSRKGRKHVTFVTGLEDLEDIQMKEASKALGKRFACSASLAKNEVGRQQIQLQGDCTLELMDVLPEMFGISADQVIVLEDKNEKKKGGSSGSNSKGKKKK